jgi:ribulose-phosphate 3-epimerase
MTRPIRIAPSILSADFTRLGDEIRAIDAGGADYIHVDVMDGHFVPNITIGPLIVSAIEHLIGDVDLILVMSVNPGFGGQKFIAESYTKLRQARTLIGNRPIDLQVDGGVSEHNAKALADAGADVYVAGTSVFSGNDPKTYAGRIAAIRNAATTVTA